MPEQFNLRKLESEDFEILCQDLAAAEYGMTFQKMGRGPDGGIDLRATLTDNRVMIIQCKHYIGSEYAQLKSAMLKELQKVIELNKSKGVKYALLTSLSLTKKQIYELVSLFAQFMDSEEFVLHGDEIQRILRENPNIVANHPVLWSLSADLMKRIVHSSSHIHSDFKIQEIINKSAKFVKTKSSAKLMNRLSKERVVIVKGDPGVGKTTVAEIALLTIRIRGYDMFYVESVLEAMEVLSLDKSKKQVILLDDFFGHSINDLHTEKSSIDLKRLIGVIRNSKDRYLIITSRTAVLERRALIDQYLYSSRSDLNEFEVEISNSSSFERAKILYKHLLHSSIPKELITVFTRKEVYMKIIQHWNYTPRLVEYLTSEAMVSKIGDYSEAEFILEIDGLLKDPREIWDYHFNEQLHPLGQTIIIGVWSLGSTNVLEEELTKHVENRQCFELKHGRQTIANESFSKSIKALAKSLVKRVKNGDNVYYTLINPSLGDYLFQHIKNDEVKGAHFVRSLTYLQEVRNHFSIHDKNKIDNSKWLNIIVNRVLDDELQASGENGNYLEEQFFTLLEVSLDFDMLDECCIGIIESNLLNSLSQERLAKVLYYLYSRLSNKSLLIDFIRGQDSGFWKALIKQPYYLSTLSRIIEIVDSIGVNLSDYFNSDEFKEVSKEVVFQYVDDEIDFGEIMEEWDVLGEDKARNKFASYVREIEWDFIDEVLKYDVEDYNLNISESEVADLFETLFDAHINDPPGFDESFHQHSGDSFSEYERIDLMFENANFT